MTKQKSESAGFIPKFEWSFLHPRYWGLWFAVFILILVALIPIRWRDPILAKLGCFIGRRVKSARKRAQINLIECFPNQTEQEREKLIDDMFAVILPVTVLLADITIKKTGATINWHGFEHFLQPHNNKQNVILMVPHGWAIDLPAVLLAQKGYPMSGMFHNQSNKLVDWLWNKARLRFGGQLHARDDGIKPFIQSIRGGQAGFYLPDEDHGPEHSVFVDFFGTYKATLPILGRIMKLCKAEVLPLFPVYNPKTSTLDIYIRPAMNDLLGQDDEYIARRMNEEIEALVNANPEQYAWVLRFLKTRKPGDKILY